MKRSALNGKPNLTLTQYVGREMVDAGWHPSLMLDDDQLIARWGLMPEGEDRKKAKRIANRRLWKLTTGHNRDALPCIRLGQKTRRYKPTDVLEFEYRAKA